MIQFKPGKSQLTVESYDVIDDILEAIIANPSWEEVHLSVHTSGCLGDVDEQKLSEERALSIMRVLISEGVVPERLVATGKGKSEPLGDGTGANQCRKNERVEIEIKKAVAP